MTSKKRLGLIACCLIIYVGLLFLLLFLERGGEKANIKNLADAVWYSLVTLTTVGYGDFFPTTMGGRLVGFLFLLGSVGLLGLLVSRLTDSLATAKERRKMGFNGTDFTHHVVIAGWNRLGQMVGRQVITAGIKLAVITDRKDDIDLIYEQFPQGRVFVLLADFRDLETWNKANLEQSTAVFLNLTNDTDKLVCVLNLKKRFQNLSLVVTLENEDLKDTFQSAGVTFTIGKESVAANLLASYTFEPDVAAFHEDLLAADETDSEQDIKQYKVLAGNPFLGRKYLDLFIEFKRQFNAVLIGLVKFENGQRRLLKNPSDDIVIDSGDYMILIVDNSAARKISQAFQSEEGL